MGEVLSQGRAVDDGSLTGRGAPVLRGVVCGAMTTAGGLGHTLPYLIPDFFVATVISICVVAAELARYPVRLVHILPL